MTENDANRLHMITQMIEDGISQKMTGKFEDGKEVLVYKCGTIIRIDIKGVFKNEN